jgi:Ala-tRNA(Pro) deacylase
MSVTKLKQYLDREGVRYDWMTHAAAYTAPETAESAHISGNDFAKTVMVIADDELAMVVVPANRKLALEALRELLEAEDVRLAREDEFRHVFPDCETGAMPPFGNLYDVPVYVAHRFADEPRFAFNAGTHRNIIRMSFADYANLAMPKVLEVAMI